MRTVVYSRVSRYKN